MRSSIPQASDGTSAYSLPKRVLPTFFNPIGLPAAAMIPRSQRPSSLGGGFAAVLVFGTGFLAAGLTAGGSACVAAIPGVGWGCPQADAVRHDRTTATPKDRTIKTSGGWGRRDGSAKLWRDDARV